MKKLPSLLVIVLLILVGEKTFINPRNVVALKKDERTGRVWLITDSCKSYDDGVLIDESWEDVKKALSK